MLFINFQMAHLTSFFLTVNYALTAFIRLQDKAQSISNLQFSSVSEHIIQCFNCNMSDKTESMLFNFQHQELV